MQSATEGDLPDPKPRSGRRRENGPADESSPHAIGSGERLMMATWWTKVLSAPGQEFANQPSKKTSATSFIPLRWTELFLLLVFAAVTTYFAWLGKPFWDDGLLALLQATDPVPIDQLRDRPLYGALLLWTGHHHLAALAIHTVAWLGIGLAALVLWSLAFPERPQLRLAVALLAMAPVLCRFQPALVNGTQYLLQVDAVALAIGGFYLLGPNELRSWKRGLAGGGSALIVFTSGLLSEYAVPAAIAGSVLLWFQLQRRGVATRSRLLLVGSLLGSSIAAYGVFWATADAQVRGDVRPEQVLSGSGFLVRVVRDGSNLLNDVWQLSLGRTLASFGQVSFQTDKKVLLFLVAGAGTAISVWIASVKKPEAKLAPPELRTISVLFLAMVAGLLPVALMERVGSYYDVDTRFWLPVLPIAACVTVSLIIKLTRQSFAFVVITGLTFVCGYAMAKQGYKEFQNVRSASHWGRILYPKLSPEGMNVFFFSYEAPETNKCLVIESSYELTARLSEAWPTADRNRVWVWTAPLWGNEIPDPPSEINVRIRGVTRKGPVSKYFWASVAKSGGMRRLMERTGGSDQWSPVEF